MADYAFTNDGSGGVYHRPTSQPIPRDPRNRDWQAYLAWDAAGGTADADIRTVAEAREHAVTAVHAEAERELAGGLPGGLALPAAALTLEAKRREAAAAAAEGTPWATGYPFLEAQVGLHGADVGAVATYWLGVWSTFEGKATVIEATREQALADIAAAGTVALVDQVLVDLSWPNQPEPTPAVFTIVAPSTTLVGPVPAIDLTPSPVAATPQAAAVTVAIA